MADDNKYEYQELADYYDINDFSDLVTTAKPPARPAEYRPPKPAETMTTFSVRLPVAVLDEVCKLAECENKTTGAKFREIIEDYVANRQDKNAVIPVSALQALIAQARIG